MNQRRQMFPRNNMNLNNLFFPRNQVPRRTRPCDLIQNGTEEKLEEVTLPDVDSIEEVLTEEERTEKERIEKERIEKERVEIERAEIEPVERERMEIAQTEIEQAKKERIEIAETKIEQTEKERAEIDHTEKEQREGEVMELEQTEIVLKEELTMATPKRNRKLEEVKWKILAEKEKEEKEKNKKKAKKTRRRKIPTKRYRPTNQTYLKQSLGGSLTLMEGATQNSTYHITSINLNLAKLRNAIIKFEFGCNILTMDAVVTLSFQIFKQYGSQVHPIPLSSMWVFAREDLTKVQSDSFSFQVCDTDIIFKEYCNYSVRVTVYCRRTQGTTIITNGTLTALIIDSYHPRI